MTHQQFRVHVAGTSGDHDQAARFHTAARRLAPGAVRTGIAAGRPWAALTVTAAGPFDATFTVGRHMERATGELTELFAWPDADEAWPSQAATTPAPATAGQDLAAAADVSTGGQRRDG